MSNQSAATAAKKQSKALQLVLALLFLAGFAVLAFLPDAAGFKGDSFFDLITRLFRDGAASLGKFAGAAMYGVLGFYAALIVLTVVSFFVKGKGALVLNYVKAVLAVLAFALFALALRKDGTAGFAAILTDVNAALLARARRPLRRRAQLLGVRALRHRQMPAFSHCGGVLRVLFLRIRQRAET